MQLTKYFPDDHEPYDSHHHLHDGHHHDSPLHLSHCQGVIKHSDELSTEGVRQSQRQFSTASEVRFYSEQKRVFTVSYHLWLQRQRQKQVWEEMARRIKAMEDRMQECRADCTQSEENRAKRSRRTAEMIEKKYRCRAPFCEKSYGAEGSLQQHIKIKHPELYSREEEALLDSPQDSDFSKDF